MSYSNKKVVGVWFDHKDASISATSDKSNKGEYSVVEKIHNKHHSDHSASEKNHNNKTSNEIHKYYEELSKHIESYDSILLFGHGNAQEQLHNFLNDHKSFTGKEIIVKTGNRFTDNEIVAFVRNNFE